jgi:glycerol-3-phosphate dehydrogenase
MEREQALSTPSRRVRPARRSWDNPRMVVPERCDLLVVGGGIHGAGIARDAAGRGLSAILVEQYDLAAATSMASSKLIHGGLRYLEQGHLRLVREALCEREILLHAAPHLVRPLSFLMPLGPGSRPAWQLRAGLWLYDRVAGRSSLPPSRTMEIDPACGLRAEHRRGLVYSDAWGDDARLVVANARAAADQGAAVLTRTRCSKLEAVDDGWSAWLERQDGTAVTVTTRAVVNATGPWVADFLRETAGIASRSRVRLVKGSHLVLRRRPDGDRALILQNTDGRVVFVVPFEQDFTLVGTTDVPMRNGPGLVDISPGEIDYLRGVMARHFAVALRDDEIVWSYAGIRALHDDGSDDPSQVSRDYVLELDRARNGAPILSVYGGKLTTYRRLAERALRRLAPALPGMGSDWTAGVALPGGEIPGRFDAFSDELVRRYPGLPAKWVRAIARRHGNLSARILQSAQRPDDLGRHFGGGLTAAEVDYLVEREWASTAEDVLFRRTKAGVHMTQAERGEVARYLERG